MGGRSDLLRDEVLGDRREVFVALVAILLEGCLMPFRAKLAAAADVGDRIDTALAEPRGADAG